VTEPAHSWGIGLGGSPGQGPACTPQANCSNWRLRLRLRRFEFASPTPHTALPPYYRLQCISNYYTFFFLSLRLTWILRIRYRKAFRRELEPSNVTVLPAATMNLRTIVRCWIFFWSRERQSYRCGHVPPGFLDSQGARNLTSTTWRCRRAACMYGYSQTLRIKPSKLTMIGLIHLRLGYP